MSPTAVLYVAQAIHGLAYGMLLFLVASGLTMIFGMMGILNIAHASFAMLSAYFCYQVLLMTENFWVALLIAPVVAGICGVLTERFLLRTVHKQGHLAELLITVGIMMVILEIVKVGWGAESLVVKIPPEFERTREFCRSDLPDLSTFRYRVVHRDFGHYGLDSLQDPLGQDRAGRRFRRGYGQRPGD